MILRDPKPLLDTGGTLVDWLDHWSIVRSEQVFIAQREKNEWRCVTYRDVAASARRLGAVLLELGASPTRPLLILAPNGIDHVVAMLAGLYAGVPVASVALAYASAGPSFDKLGAVFDALQPAVIYAQGTSTTDALATMKQCHEFRTLASTSSITPVRAESNALLAAAREGIGPDTVAKIMFTSGSTGAPKGVIHTHGMWSANQQQIAQAWPFLSDEPPVLLDWLPWNHTFGGNHNLGLVLRHGGTLYVDDGAATPAAIERTVRNLREVAPTMYFNVPKGYDLLLPALKHDEAALRNLFARSKLIMSAAAALPAHVAAGLRDLARVTSGRECPIVTGWGSTETAPGATVTPLDAAGDCGIGLPLPGVELKMIPVAANYELRVRGPNVTPGYWGRPDLRASIFDEEGFYRIGDIGRLIDPKRPEQGISFVGRMAEEFKLSTGTWVQVSPLRLRAIEEFAPLVQDAVVAGANRDFVSLLLFMNWQQCRVLLGEDAREASEKEIASDPRIRRQLRRALGALARSGGSSTYPARCLVQLDAPDAASGEITDKGYLNQAVALRRRASEVERLYAAQSDEEVICLEKEA